MVGMLLLGALLIIGVYFTAASAAHHKGPLYQGIGGVAICSVYGCFIHYHHMLKLRPRQRSALFWGGVLLLLIGSLVASLAGDYTLLAISLGGPASAFVFRHVLDLPERL